MNPSQISMIRGYRESGGRHYNANPRDGRESTPLAGREA
jgi:hypothetical protein